jgi:MFS family permease
MTVVILSLVGLLINVSTTMIYSNLPMYMKNVLGASAKTTAFIDGLVEFISYLTRIASGVISDFMQNRKKVLVFGYGLAVLSKPLYLLASNVLVIFIAQAINRFSNGTIASPRDALVGDVTSEKRRGASYGFMRSMKTIGSVFGAFFGMGILYTLSANYHNPSASDFMTVFMIATMPAFISMILLILFVKEPKTHRESVGNAVMERKDSTQKKTSYLKNLKKLSTPFWMILCVAITFEMAHFSESLLTWRANDVGLPQALGPIVMVTMNIGQFLVAYPLGYLSDRYNRRMILIIGFVFMIFANLLMGFGTNIFLVMLGIFFWGAQMSTTVSIFLSLISDVVDKEVRGTAFGVFYFVTGLSYLASSTLAGHLWDAFGPSYSFFASIGFASLAILLAFFVLAPKPLSSNQNA